MNDFHDLYDKERKYVRTELSDPSAVSAQASKKSISWKGWVFTSTIANPNETSYRNNH